MYAHINGKKLAGKILAAALCLTMLAGVFAGTMRDDSAGALTLAAADSRQELSAADIYEQNVNSTVGITTSITTNYWGYETKAAVAGSGFIITADGYILTNYHVVDNADSITVSLYDGTTYDAKLVGYDESNDLAVLKVDAQGLDPVTVDDSGDLRVGDEVVAIGNPLGELTFSLTGGMVSALDREITVSTGVTMDLIQTDCAINSGNSGGALFNMYGEVVGITNAKYSGSGMGASIDNIGFAIPIQRVAATVQSIIEKGYIAKPYIGVTVSDVSNEARGYGLPEGAAVKSVEEDGPSAGLIQENDIITAVNGQAVSGRHELSDIVTAAQVGSELDLTIYRQGQETHVTVTVGEKEQSALPKEEQEPAPDGNGPSQDEGQEAWQQFGDSFEDFLREYGREHSA